MENSINGIDWAARVIEARERFENDPSKVNALLLEHARCRLFIHCIGLVH